LFSASLHVVAIDGAIVSDAMTSRGSFGSAKKVWGDPFPPGFPGGSCV
jgi:hypothetical protein